MAQLEVTITKNETVRGYWRSQQSTLEVTENVGCKVVVERLPLRRKTRYVKSRNLDHAL